MEWLVSIQTGDPLHIETSVGVGLWPQIPLVITHTTPSRASQRHRTLEQSFKAQVKCQLRDKTLKGWGAIPQVMEPSGRSRSGSISHCFQWTTKRFCVPHQCKSELKGVWNPSPQRGTLWPEDTEMGLLNYKLWLPPGHLGLLIAQHQQTRSRFAILVEIIDPVRKGGKASFTHRSKKDCVWNSNIPLDASWYSFAPL